MKSILLPVTRDSGVEARLQVALDVARGFDAHLTCLQVTPLEDYAAIEPYGVSYLAVEAVQKIRELQEQERQETETRLANEGISWDWIVQAGSGEQLIGDYSWLADLVVMSSPTSDSSQPGRQPASAGDVVMHARAPLLVVPQHHRAFDCAAPVAIAWNGSPEACAAIRAALPLLKQASHVKLLTVGEDGGLDLPPLDAAEYLSRHGVSSKIVELEKGPGPISELLLESAEAMQASCLVMGAYGHSRLRENIFGGVTKGVLTKAKLPLLLAH